MPDWLEVRKVAGFSAPELEKMGDGEWEAERRKIRVMGTIRVLDDAAEAGLMDLPAALQQC